jgi:oligopeptide/dipeptide ABC transporter ATP-binding protein
MTETLLEVQNLTVGIRKEKHTLTAVDDISFELYQGEIAGIAGESGCGKSLTALAAAGLLPRAAETLGGRVILNSPGGKRDLLAMTEKELCGIRGRDISMVFQEPYSSLNPLIKIGRQIAEPPEIHGEKDKALIQKKVIDMMESLGLPEPETLAGAYPHRLSGGMCQRVMIALALICRPRLLIADEPTTALDVTIQKQILDLMKEINSRYGTAILFISHDLSVLRRIAARVFVMYSGRIVEEGPVEAVFGRPGHEYTKGLIGAIPGRNSKGRDLANIPGRVPPLEAGRPPGCPFAPRCGKVRAECTAAFPAPAPLGEGHTARCIGVQP